MPLRRSITAHSPLEKCTSIPRHILFSQRRIPIKTLGKVMLWILVRPGPIISKEWGSHGNPWKPVETPRKAAGDVSSLHPPARGEEMWQRSCHPPTFRRLRRHAIVEEIEFDWLK